MKDKSAQDEKKIKLIEKSMFMATGTKPKNVKEELENL